MISRLSVKAQFALLLAVVTSGFIAGIQVWRGAKPIFVP
jgi:hypothetical protein